jgi:hypothetical protein
MLLEKNRTMQRTIERFLEASRLYFFEENVAGGPCAPLDSAGKEVKDMRPMDERQRQALASRMKQAVANPPHRAFARELLARGMSANEVWQMVMRDTAFVRVPESFRIAIANAAREMMADQLLAASKAQGSGRRPAS